MTEYSEAREGVRVVDTGQSRFSIVLDRGTALWSIETSAGSLPVALRDKRYTSHQYALKDIKNYLDGHNERKIIYKNTKVKKADE